MEVNLFDYNYLSNNDQFFIFNPCKDIKYLIGDKHISNPYINLYVDEMILSKNNDTDKDVALLLEPRCIKPQLYSTIEVLIKTIEKKYKAIITHDQRILNITDKAILLPFTGGSLILPEDANIYYKTKNISIIASQKNYAPGHKLRHEVIKELGSDIDAYGPNYKNLYTYPIADKSDRQGYYNYVTGNLLQAYKPYRFCIAIENQQDHEFFSEKIIDCFLTGTIPIYWGALNIGKYFNTEGIIQFSSIDKLKNIIKTILKNPKTIYNDLISKVEENFTYSKRYRSYDTYLKNIIEKLYD